MFVARLLCLHVTMLKIKYASDVFKVPCGQDGEKQVSATLFQTTDSSLSGRKALKENSLCCGLGHHFPLCATVFLCAGSLCTLCELVMKPETPANNYKLVFELFDFCCLNL